MPRIKKLIKPGLLISAFVCAVVFGAFAVRDRSSAPAPAPSVPVQTASSEIYTLRADDGVVCILSGDKTAAVTDIDVSSLRAVDRDMLTRGVSVESWNEVLRFLEDFSS